MWSPYANGHFSNLPDSDSDRYDSAKNNYMEAQEDSPPPGLSQSGKQGEELCTICGDRASGYHYNALSCEGCKGFFRRSIMRGAFYECKYDGDCKMDMWMRRKCQACRLKQCREVGMKEECLLSERQCVARNVRRKTRQKIKTPVSSSSRRSHDQTNAAAVAAKQALVTIDEIARTLSPCQADNILDKLSDEQRELVKRLVVFQDKFELPSEDDMSKVSELNISASMDSTDISDAIFVHLVEMTILVTRLVIEFAKRLPGFQNITKDDQIILLKCSASEVMMLRTARRYDPETNTVVFGNGTPFSSDSMAFGGLQGFVDIMFEFSKGMSVLYVDNAEYALLTAICIFSLRQGLSNSRAVERIQEVYTEVLISYVKLKHPKGGNHLAKLLMKLVELRTLGHEHSRTLYNLKLQKGHLPPLLMEYFDIQE